MARLVLGQLALCLLGCGGPTDAAKPAPAEPTLADLPPGRDAQQQAGREVFAAHCTKCHLEGLGDAPIVLDRSAWAARVEQPKETLYRHALEGFWGDVGEMPARGDHADLSDEQVRNAVDYIVSIHVP